MIVSCYLGAATKLLNKIKFSLTSNTLGVQINACRFCTCFWVIEIRLLSMNPRQHTPAKLHPRSLALEVTELTAAKFGRQPWTSRRLGDLGRLMRAACGKTP